MTELQKKFLMRYKIKSFAEIHSNHISLSKCLEDIDRKSKLDLT